MTYVCTSTAPVYAICMISDIPPEAMPQRPFHYRRSFMYAAIRVISYIAESDASSEKESGSVAKLWASNIRFGYCAILTVT